jgi:hypothetical protein
VLNLSGTINEQKCDYDVKTEWENVRVRTRKQRKNEMLQISFRRSVLREGVREP